MIRRHFLAHISKYVGGTMGAAIAVLNYQAGEAKEDIGRMEDRLRELEAYNTANVVKIQFLLSQKQ